MLQSKDYLWSVAFGLVCGLIAFFIISNPKTPVESVLLQSAIVGLVGAAGCLYGRYNRLKEQQKSVMNKKSKKSMKREMKGK